MDSELFCEVIEGVETVAEVKALLVLPVAALHLAIVVRCIGTNELVADTQVSRSSFKEGRELPPAVGKTVGEFKSVVRLYAFHADAPAGVPLDQLFQKVSGGKGRLLWVGGQEAQTGELVNGGVLVQTQFRVGDAALGDHFHIHLDPLTRVGHLLIGFGLISWFLFCLWEHPEFPHHPEQAFRAAGIAPLLQAVPQFHHAQVRISAAHVPNQLQFRLCVLVWMAVGPTGLTRQGFCCAIPPGLPEVDIRPAFVILPAGPADAVFLCILH